MDKIKNAALIVLILITVLLFFSDSLSDNYKWLGVLALWIGFYLRKLQKAYEADYARLMDKVLGMHQSNQDEIKRLERGALHRLEGAINGLRGDLMQNRP